MKNKFLIISLVIMVIILGTYFIKAVQNSGTFGTTPSKTQDAFVTACGELNGKELNYSNISTLHGQCYVSCGKLCVTVRSCQEKDISDHVSSNSSGELKITEANDKNYNKLSISQKGLDGAWKCSIELQNGKIRAVPSFFYD